MHLLAVHEETSPLELRPLSRGAGGEEKRPELVVELLLLGAEDVEHGEVGALEGVPAADKRLRSLRGGDRDVDAICCFLISDAAGVPIM